LARIAPDTPGVVETLLEGASVSEPVPWTRVVEWDEYAVTVTAADVAVESLLRLARSLRADIRSVVLAPGGLRGALAAFGGASRVEAVSLWWEVTGSLDDCPLPLPSVIRREPSGWYDFWWRTFSTGIDPRLTLCRVLLTSRQHHSPVA
jgi:hypothetical protein